MIDQLMKSTGCCEPFNPEPWQGKEIIWKDKIFVKDRITSFLHIPLNMGKKIVKNMKSLALQMGCCSNFRDRELYLLGCAIFV